MATANILQQVQTYQPSALAYFENLNCLVGTANSKFKDFENITTNLGSTVNMELIYRFTSSAGLVAIDQAITQRVHSLVVDQAANTSMVVTNPDQIFNLDKDAYMEKIGKAAMIALGARVEGSLALNANSHVPVMIIDPSDPSQWIPSGALHVESGPIRFYGDGVTAINSYQQLQQSVENFMELGHPGAGMKMYMPNSVVPAIIGSGLNQFVPKRNEETAQSWEIGVFGTPEVRYYKSNMLPVHTAGTVGNTVGAGNYLTVVSTNDPTGVNVTQITCSSPITTDSQAIKSGDLGVFVATTNYATPKAMTRSGQVVTSQPVQIRIIADAGTSGGSITITLVADDESKGLCWASTANQNCSVPIVAGMRIQVMPTHRCGLMVSDNALFLAMPRLPDQNPFITHAEYDTDTGVSLRLAYGSLLGQNKQRLVHDCIWASTLIPTYSQRILFPV